MEAIMVQLRQRVLESPCGIGKVYRNGRPVAEVQYRLVVTQEYQGMEQTPRGTDITGRVTVIDGSRDLASGGSLTLELEDGRRYPFTPQRGSRSLGAYEFNARTI
jgi:hypothetical protein